MAHFAGVSYTQPLHGPPCRGLIHATKQALAHAATGAQPCVWQILETRVQWDFALFVPAVGVVDVTATGGLA